MLKTARIIMVNIKNYSFSYPYLPSIILVLIVWYFSSEYRLIGPTLLSKPSEVLEAFYNSFKTDVPQGQNVFLHAKATILRSLLGWGISIIIGLALGVLLGSTRLLYDSSEPLIEFIRSIPPILVFPLLLVAFNYGGMAYIGTIIFGCLPIVILTISRGVQRISKEKMEMLDIFKANIEVKLFAAGMEILPSLFTGARIAFSTGLVIAIVTEMVFTPRSGIALGSLAKDAEISFDTPLFYASVIIIGFFGYTANMLMRKLEEIWE